jgi:hypothetical protein
MASKQSHARLITLTAIMIALAFCAWFGPTALRQQRGMRLAAQHVPLVEARLQGEPRFDRVRVGVGTGGGGTLLVVGRVASKDDLARLRTLVAETKPAVEARFAVQVD